MKAQRHVSVIITINSEEAKVLTAAIEKILMVEKSIAQNILKSLDGKEVRMVEDLFNAIKDTP